MFHCHFKFRRPHSEAVNQSVGASPYTYTDATVNEEIVTVSGGTVSQIEVNTAGAGFVVQVGTSGDFTVFPAGAVKVTYSVAPTVGVVEEYS